MSAHSWAGRVRRWASFASDVYRLVNRRGFSPRDVIGASRLFDKCRLCPNSSPTRLKPQVRDVSTQAVSTLLIGLLGIALVMCMTSKATAAIYWGNGTPIGRTNLDGTEPQSEFIKYVPFGSSTEASGCGAVAVDSVHVFWTDPGSDSIGRANLDGSDPNYAFITGAENPCGITVDGEHIYWANFGSNAIGRANLDGSEAAQAFISAVTEPCGVAVDSKFIYWTSSTGHYVGRALVQTGDKGPHLVDGDGSFDFCGVAVNGSHLFWGGFGDRIGRIDLDGSSANPAYISGLERPCGIAVDATHIYWTEEVNSGRVVAANLDGSLPSRSLVTGLARPCGLAVDRVSVSRPLPQTLSRFSFGKVRSNKRNGVGFLPVYFPGGGYLHVKVTAGLRWALRPDRLTGGVLSGAGQRWLKIWPGQKGGHGRRIREQLRARGRAVVGVEVEYAEMGHLPTRNGKRIKLLRSR